ncbi:hypothetical protein STEG23_000123, partial [Scotinomys teguina]
MDLGRCDCFLYSYLNPFHQLSSSLKRFQFSSPENNSPASALSVCEFGVAQCLDVDLGRSQFWSDDWKPSGKSDPALLGVIGAASFYRI